MEKKHMAQDAAAEMAKEKPAEKTAEAPDAAAQNEEKEA